MVGMRAVEDKSRTTEYVGFRCAPSLRDRLNAVAEAEERSIAYLVRVFVAEGLKAYEGGLPLPSLRKM